MARQKYDPALLLSCEPQQGIGQVLFAERLNLLAAVPVANDNFTTAGDTEFTYPFRCQVRVDELQCDVILEALVSADQVLDLTTRELIFTNIGGNLDGLIHLAQQAAAAFGYGIACPGGPVCLVDILCAQPGQHANNGDKQYSKDQALQA